MKEEYSTEKNHGWIFWISLVAVLIIGVGIFFYYTFLQQSHSDLMGTIPTEATFVFEINDNETFEETVKPLLPYFNEMFAMDILPAYETIYHKLPKRKTAYRLTISGHEVGNSTHLLFNTYIEKNDFKKLLRALRIDPANYTKFDQYKIYTFGTNFKSLKFVYFNHVLTLSDDIELVRKSLVQHAHPKSLLSNKEFKGLYELSNKNIKQNWLFIHHESLKKTTQALFTEQAVQQIQPNIPFGEWSAFQLRIVQNELFLSGYTPLKSETNIADRGYSAASFPVELIPFDAYWFHKLEFQTYALCRFGLVSDSASHYEYMVLMQDTAKRAIIPYDNLDQAEEMRTTYPSGIYPVTDSTFSGSLSQAVAKYSHFIERNGYYLFASSEEAIAHYNKVIKSRGTLLDNRLYKFSANNVATSNIEEFNYYNSKEERHRPILFSPSGLASPTIRDLQIASATWTGTSDHYAATNIYLNFIH